MKDKRKIGIIVTVVVMLLTVFGVTYAFVNFTLNGNENSVLVTGDIYMNYTETNQINLTNAVPMSKEDALKLNDNIFKFTITGKNQSRKDIYYGISIVYGEEQAGKTRLKDEDIDVYLTSGEDVLVNANRYKSLNDTRIWAEKIDANTENYTKDYSLRLWVDESVIISDTDANKDYTQDVWNNSYASFKVKVDGNLNEMNVPLSVDNKDTYYEHGEEYILVSISNYLNPHEAGLSLVSLDTMKLQITSSNSDLMFTYSDSENGSSTEKKNSLDLTYSFNENKVINIKVFPTSNSYSKIDTDINIKLTKNDNETYEMLKRIHIDEITSTCIKKGYNNLSDCLLITEQMSASNVNEAKEAIEAKGEVTLSQTSEQANENGMYKTVDNDGDTYFYRGDVKNNNVKFAGFYWKIVRINGDGSIRLIYNGDHANATGIEASSVTGKGEPYNTRIANPAYVGYMYGDNFSKEPIKSEEATYTNIDANTKYYFGTGYTPDASAKTFTITGADYSGTFTEWNIANKLSEGYKYTCRSTTADETCEFLIEITKFNSATSVQAYYWTYGSTSYEATREDTASSNAKTLLENWYETKLEKTNELGINAVNYISNNATFCNDRSLSSKEGNGNGFSLVPAIYYGSEERIQEKKAASLICPNMLDLFSAKGSEGKGNKKLEKPIGLITADEVALAGGLNLTENRKYYLYTGQSYWTMSSGDWYPSGLWSTSYILNNGGSIFANGVRAHFGLRAVINLNSNVLVKNGNGTMDDPYTIKLAN